MVHFGFHGVGEQSACGRRLILARGSGKGLLSVIANGRRADWKCQWVEMGGEERRRVAIFFAACAQHY